MVDRFERFSLSMFEITKYWHKLTAEEMDAYGLKGPHSMYLIAMYQHPEGVTASQLCDLCCRDKADVSRMMSILEQKGLVTKEAQQSMYRGLWKLTEAGIAATEKVQQRVHVAVELAGQGLTDDVRSNFYKALELISSNLRRLSEEGLPPAPTED